MKSITQIGMDVHKNSFTVCCFDLESEQVKYTVTLEPDYKQVLKYIENIRKHYPEETEFECGYEAGCLGYSLYHQLTEHGVKCTILAPTTMSEHDNKRFKTDKRDAANIAKCLAYHTYSKVFVPTNEDNAIKEFIVWFVIHIPQLLFLAIFVAVIWISVKKYREMKKAKPVVDAEKKTEGKDGE